MASGIDIKENSGYDNVAVVADFSNKNMNIDIITGKLKIQSTEIIFQFKPCAKY